MSVTPLFATAGATNAGLYPAQGLSERLAETGQFPPLMARKLGGRASLALLIFTLITAAHFRVRAETGARVAVLAVAIATAGGVLLTFVFTTLIHEPASMVTLLAIVVLSAALDFGWKRVHAGRSERVPVGR